MNAQEVLEKKTTLKLFLSQKSECPLLGVCATSFSPCTLSVPTLSVTTTSALQVELEQLKSQLIIKETELSLAKEHIDELKARELDAKHQEQKPRKSECGYWE